MTAGPDIRAVQEGLMAAGDHAGAFLWRRVCRDLDGVLRVGVASRDPATANRLIARLQGAIAQAEWVSLPMQTDEPGPTLGGQDRMLGVHVLIWATQVTAALGSWERSALTALEQAAAPGRRAVVLADAHLLDRLSDDPELEEQEVRRRVQSLLPQDWALLDEDAISPWLLQSEQSLPELVALRRRGVSRLLLSDALERADEALARARGELHQVHDLLAAEQAALDAARREGERTAAHMLGAMRRHTQQLLIDLKALLVDLEKSLPAEVDAVEDVEVVQRTLAHWLSDVVEQWMMDRLAQWRADVLADLHEVGITEAELARAELLVPALHPPPLRRDAHWGTRIGVTAAAGTGAVLLLMGQWVVGLLALSGGLAWGAAGRGGRETADRAKLVTAATGALRQMGTEGERLLGDQLDRLEHELQALGEHKALVLAEDRSERRAWLESRQATRAARTEDLAGIRDGLVERIDQLGVLDQA